MLSSDVIIAELYELFRQRYAEVNRYLEFTVHIADSRAVGLMKEEEGQLVPVSDYRISRELTKTLRANAFLLLYNLVEATMTNAIDAIHRAIINDELGYSDLSEKLKAISIKHFRRAVSGDSRVFMANIEHPIGLAVVCLGYDRERIFSGNVDCGEIRKAADDYGFLSPNPNLKGRRILKNLEDLRDKRNGLAHGRLSFEQCGHDTATDYLERVSRQTAVYLRTVLWSVSSYLRNRQYSADPLAR